MNSLTQKPSASKGMGELKIGSFYDEHFDIQPHFSREKKQWYRRLSNYHPESVTGVPTLVELDETFNPLDPGQLLRESAAAASRAALQSYHFQSIPSESSDSESNDIIQRPRAPSLVDDLLHEIYQDKNETIENDNIEVQDRSQEKCLVNLRRKDLSELRIMHEHLKEALSRVGSVLRQQLTERDQFIVQREKNYDLITAILQAASPKRSQDTRMRFSVDPPSYSGDSGFQQWHDAMRMVARLPGGVPAEFRRKLWLTLAEQHLLRKGVHWEEAERTCFNEKTNPDDEDLGAQIVRDLHRTGCSLFCGDEALPNQALLKRVLLAYARWNKAVGYCQGLNVLAALLIEVMNRSEVESLKVMIYLIEGVLPEGYFANNLRGLSVDMAVFRDLLKQRHPVLSRHLEHLQMEARDTVTNTSYEPPLTNVFTMQWFLTLFATCLPKAAVLRIWDLIFLEGNDILLRTALAIWDGLADRVLTVSTADDFYSIMGVLAREMLEFGLMEPNRLVQTVVNMAEFPFPGLAEIRDKYRYNITPWNGGGTSVRLFYCDDEAEAEVDEDDDEKTKATVATAFGLVSVFKNRRIVDTFKRQTNEKERLQLDIAALRKQYAKLRERQRQAHIIWTAATSGSVSGLKHQINQSIHQSSSVLSSNSSNPVSHLLAGRKPLLNRRPSTTQQPGPKLQLPATRVQPSKANSAPTTPSGKDDEQKPIMSINSKITTRRNSGTAAAGTREEEKTVEKDRKLPVANRSRLAQELLEQNSAILQKLKDNRSEIALSHCESENPSSNSNINNSSSSSSGSHSSSGQSFNPFPKQLPRQPKDVTVKLGLYGSPQKY